MKSESGQATTAVGSRVIWQQGSPLTCARRRRAVRSSISSGASTSGYSGGAVSAGPVRWPRLRGRGPCFLGPPFGDIAVQRLLHRSVVLNLDGDSYRFRDHHVRQGTLRGATLYTDHRPR
jgi:hypothetical protein